MANNIAQLDSALKSGDVSGGNYKETQEDGTQRSYGNATVFDDIIGNIFGQRLNSTVGKIDYDYTENAIKFQSGGSISTVADRAQINMQMPHRMLFGPTAYFDLHFHWWQSDVVERTLTLEYRIQDNGSAKVTAWTQIAVTTNTGSEILPYTSGTINQITEFPVIDVTGCDISSTIQWRVARTDSNAGDLYVFFMDAHYKIDSDGSKLEWSKD